MTAGDPGRGGSIVVVVRRGAVDRFATLHDTFLSDEVAVVWDRRVGDRRRASPARSSGGERRRHERRGPPPPSWTLLDFVVVSELPPYA